MQTLSFENTNTTTQESTPDQAFTKKITLTDKELGACVRIQAVMRGIIARKLVRTKLTDVTLNSFANVSQMTGMNERQMKKKFVLADGSIYTGQVRLDTTNKNQEEWIPDGQGKIKFPSNDKYQGGFVGGKPHGNGAKTIVATRTVIKGVFLYGMACGNGEMQQENEERAIELVYKGEFLDDRPHGKGFEQRLDG